MLLQCEIPFSIVLQRLYLVKINSGCSLLNTIVVCPYYSEVSPHSEPGNQLPPALHKIPGLDAQTGLSRVNDREQLYLQVLQMFARNHGDVPNSIRQCLETEDWE